MAVPDLQPEHVRPQALSLREARTRLAQLVALAELADTVTVIEHDRDARPVAAIVPAAAARSVAQARADAGRIAEVTAGWARRLEQTRQRSARQHASNLRVLTDALAEVWAELDRRIPSASDPALARLRAVHMDLLRR
ncbi:type II toxin-antitoxin system Phd/YefM family antitoxin [Solwaraspora sp. WMMD791]|uniref:type II toxin-antitoxin system Phd/YefM family antitoxin n=1 Tax=Solwaraspora sp. WMMD791 TaxID=3016086 RepID=UPI00249CCFDD|nr:type II toxin-antitoxin system Phd/YefM family antitoxin [Solwaraspora sp. WMMD791]WFE26079.1 type II toxin-antitoxin system Phd/YefM family antitoxin [Solwaraspora sp. WMMD791]